MLHDILRAFPSEAMVQERAALKQEIKEKPLEWDANAEGALTKRHQVANLESIKKYVHSAKTLKKQYTSGTMKPI